MRLLTKRLKSSLTSGMESDLSTSKPGTLCFERNDSNPSWVLVSISLIALKKDAHSSGFTSRLSASGLPVVGNSRPNI